MFNKGGGVEKLKALRKRWINEPENRKIIERMAKALKMGEKKLYGEELFKTAKRIFKWKKN